MVYEIWYFEKTIGRAEQIRVALVAAGQPFVNRSVGSFFSWDKNAVPGGLDWGQVPCLRDTETDRKYFQSLPILQYIGRKHGLLPEDIEEEYEILNVLHEVNEVRTDMYGYIFNGSWMGNKSLKSAQKKLTFLDEHLGSTNVHFGKELSIVDTCLFNLIHDQCEPVYPGMIINNYPNLKRHYENMLENELIQNYLGTERYKEQMGFPQIGFGGIVGAIAYQKCSEMLAPVTSLFKPKSD